MQKSGAGIILLEGDALIQFMGAFIALWQEIEKDTKIHIF